MVLGFCLIILALGIARYLQKEKSGNLSNFNDKGSLTIVGTVVDLPDKRSSYQQLKIEAQGVFIGQKEIKVSGLALAAVKLYPEYQYGDLLEIFGQLKEPKNFGDFDYKSYLAKSDIYSLIQHPEIKVLAKNQGGKIKQGLFWLKQKFENSLEKILSEPQASFLAGLTLGEKRQIPEGFSEALKRTGTVHIVALSGYNITLISAFFMAFFGFFMIRRNISFWLAVLGIVFFTILTGASASVVRAAIMGILVLVARQSGRLYSVRNALVFAGGLMIFDNPKILRFDIGFQLSFLATLGLVWIAPFFDKWFKKLPRLFGLKEILIATLSAQLAVLPLLLVYFGQLSLIAPMANLAVLIFVPLTMFLGFLIGGVGMVWLGAAKIFGWLVWLFLTLEIKLIEFFASLPLAAVSWYWKWWPAAIYYVIAILFLIRFYKQQQSQILVDMYVDK